MKTSISSDLWNNLAEYQEKSNNKTNKLSNIVDAKLQTDGQSDLQKKSQTDKTMYII